MVAMAVAVALSLAGNHIADTTGPQANATGPATPFKMAPICANLEKNCWFDQIFILMALSGFILVDHNKIQALSRTFSRNKFYFSRNTRDQ